MAAFLDGCRFNPAAGGTTDWTYSSAVTGYQSPTAANVANGRTYKYRAESADLSQWELGEGAFNTATGVLARTTILYNSSATGTKINFAAVPQVAIVALKEDLISVEEANNFTDTQKAQIKQNIGAAPMGQCRLVKSGSNIVLVPYQGNFLTINGTQCIVPGEGVSLAPTALTASTLYYIYAFLSSGAMTLEASTTAHATSTTAGNNGVEIKSGDDTRSLVGMVRPIAGPAFADSLTQRFVISWFNRRLLPLQQGTFDTGSGAIGSGFGDRSASNHCEFLTWSDEAVFACSDVVMRVESSGSASAAVNFDQTTNGPGKTIDLSTVNQFSDNSVRFIALLSEGYHLSTLYASTNAGSGGQAQITNMAEVRG